MNWLTLVLIAGATLRLTRLVTHDTITKPVRALAARHDARRSLAAGTPPVDAPGRVYSFLTCPWCVSVYVAAGTVTVYVSVPHDIAAWVANVYAALTASHLAGTAIARENRP